MKVKQYKVTLTLTQPLLGAVSKKGLEYQETEDVGDKKLEEEAETAPDLDKGHYGFHSDDTGPFLYDYVIKGFFKDAISSLRRVTGSEASKFRAYKKVIDGLVFIYPRRLYLENLPEGDFEINSRPLRASTAQGERIALAHSEQAPIGTGLTFYLQVLGGVVKKEALNEWLGYGLRKGLGQWRNASWGRFKYKLEELPDDQQVSEAPTI